jgi:hypothetical protein
MSIKNVKIESRKDYQINLNKDLFLNVWRVRPCARMFLSSSIFSLYFYLLYNEKLNTIIFDCQICIMIVLFCLVLQESATKK